MRIRIQQLKLMRINADPDPKPWAPRYDRYLIRDPSYILKVSYVPIVFMLGTGKYRTYEI
jgi:hypothetical protein